MTIAPIRDSHPTATPQMRRAAEAFEGQVLALMLKPIFATANTARSGFGGGAAEEQWQPMMTEAYANRMAAAGGLGIRDMVLGHMIRIQESAMRGIDESQQQENRP